MALTAEKQYQTMFPRIGYVVPTPVAAGTYYRGSMLKAPVNGGNASKATSAASSFFLGISQENTTKTAGQMMDVLINSPFWVENSTLAIAANVSKTVYATDDDTFTISSGSNAIPIGKIVAIEGSRFLIDPKQVGAV